MKNSADEVLGMTITPELIERRIHLIRGKKVMLDSSLAELYQVPTKVLNQAVKRNIERFPTDFMFQLTRDESGAVNRSQFVTGSKKHRDPRSLPYAFTELGVAMLSSILRSDRAVQMNIHIMRAFVELRRMAVVNTDLAKGVDRLERGQMEHTEDLAVISKAVNKLIDMNRPKKNAIGFEVEVE